MNYVLGSEVSEDYRTVPPVYAFHVPYIRYKLSFNEFSCLSRRQLVVSVKKA